jgi:hypothetical protein
MSKTKIEGDDVEQVPYEVKLKRKHKHNATMKQTHMALLKTKTENVTMENCIGFSMF